jgi:hypothetical protein
MGNSMEKNFQKYMNCMETNFQKYMNCILFVFTCMWPCNACGLVSKCTWPCIHVAIYPHAECDYTLEASEHSLVMGYGPVRRIIGQRAESHEFHSTACDVHERNGEAKKCTLKNRTI